MSRKEIDFLFEDPPVTGQTYALVSIVGPNLKQKCNMYGLKVRGVADSLEKAKAMSQKILKVDNNYDIYTVEVGKFFPLDVEPHSVSNVEYQNEQLNTLIKSYLENKETANDFWHQRKNDMIQEAIKEGKNQAEMANKPEHPIAVLQRIQNYSSKLTEMESELEELRSQLKNSQMKFDNYSEEQRQQAKKEISNGLDSIASEEGFNVDEIRSELMASLDKNVNKDN